MLPRSPLSTFQPEAPAPAQSSRRDPFEVYLGKDLRPLLLDMEQRPQHYRDTHRETARRIRSGAVTQPADRLELLLHFARQSAPAKVERDVRRSTTAAAIAPPAPPPAFEDQGLFHKAIRLI